MTDQIADGAQGIRQRLENARQYGAIALDYLASLETQGEQEAEFLSLELHAAISKMILGAGDARRILLGVPQDRPLTDPPRPRVVDPRDVERLTPLACAALAATDGSMRDAAQAAVAAVLGEYGRLLEQRSAADVLFGDADLDRAVEAARASHAATADDQDDHQRERAAIQAAIESLLGQLRAAGMVMPARAKPTYVVICDGGPDVGWLALPAASHVEALQLGRDSTLSVVMVAVVTARGPQSPFMRRAFPLSPESEGQFGTAAIASAIRYAVAGRGIALDEETGKAAAVAAAYVTVPALLAECLRRGPAPETPENDQ
ncbi:hypothetical protein [Frankia sp. AvcI1]|uniref:hypothetical protein n=1 Tax=Frankia sp. AvcI1 TaxID=573496 RepID=UPI0006EC06CA|nr:hypothetical protein [Frankia sp. AvcI1]